MTYKEIFKGLDIIEKTRRLEVIEKMNKLWDCKNACLQDSDRKIFDKKIQRIVRREASWLKEAAWFLY